MSTQSPSTNPSAGTSATAPAPATKAAAAAHDPAESHGDSPAAWTAVVIMLVAFAVGTIGFCFALPVVVWISAAFVVIGLLVGYVMKKMGLGVGGHRYVPKAH